MEYTDVILNYPEFYYHDFVILESEDEFHVQFDFEISGLSHFNPGFILPKPSGSMMYGNFRTVREAAFSLGLVELISYWKLTCSPTVIVECGSLNEEQTAWWKKLYFNGLSEFFLRNGIHPDPDTFMDLRSAGEPITGHIDQRRFSGNLIPIGGELDSLVSLELLSGMQEDNHVFIINHVMSAFRSAQIAGYTGEKMIIAERSLDSRMLDFNKTGFLNGHTPFSALCAFAASLTAVIYGIQNICLSNEASSGELTAAEGEADRPYSNTFAFEQEFKRYIDAYITPEIHCFSLLRPLNGLQTAGLFSAMEPYHSIFRSCNAGQSEEHWCGHCEKCLSVCVYLSAYLPDEKLRTIFGTDILNDPSMLEQFDQLIRTEESSHGSAGSAEELNTAAAMSVRRHLQNGESLPLLYEHYRNTSGYAYYKDKETDWSQYNTENLVPEDYQKLLKQRLEEMKEQ